MKTAETVTFVMGYGADMPHHGVASDPIRRSPGSFWPSVRIPKCSLDKRGITAMRDACNSATTNMRPRRQSDVTKRSPTSVQDATPLPFCHTLSVMASLSGARGIDSGNRRRRSRALVEVWFGVGRDLNAIRAKSPCAIVGRY
jgi:hypothetical protein